MLSSHEPSAHFPPPPLRPPPKTPRTRKNENRPNHPGGSTHSLGGQLRPLLFLLKQKRSRGLCPGLAFGIEGRARPLQGTSRSCSFAAGAAQNRTRHTPQIPPRFLSGATDLRPAWMCCCGSNTSPEGKQGGTEGGGAEGGRKPEGFTPSTRQHPKGRELLHRRKLFRKTFLLPALHLHIEPREKASSDCCTYQKLSGPELQE